MVDWIWADAFGAICKQAAATSQPNNKAYRDTLLEKLMCSKARRLAVAWTHDERTNTWECFMDFKSPEMDWVDLATTIT